MGAVDVGVGHHDDLVVAQLVGREIIADASAEAVIRVAICSLDNILSMRTRSTLRILPRLPAPPGIRDCGPSWRTAMRNRPRR